VNAIGLVPDKENRMRDSWTLVLTLGLSLALAGCGGEARSQASASPIAAAEVAEPQYESIEQFESAAIKKDVPYVPTPVETVDEMLRLAQVSRDDLVYDLGSGDGRIVITAAKKHGARGVGIDIDPTRIEEANENARAAGVTDKVKFVQGDLFAADLRPATAVTLYLLRSVNLRLRPKLLEQLRPGTPVVSHDFDMGEWPPDDHTRVGDDDVYLWIIPGKIDGNWKWTNAQARPFVARIEQTFQTFTGTAHSDGHRFNIRNGRIKGNEIAFELVRAGDETAPVLERYSGKLTDGALQGEIVTADNRRSPWRARHE
jgi:SAM-dependent methyltransferase